MIVLPMAGLSRRFADRGYTKPKFMLEAGGKSLFRHAVDSFAADHARLPFLFVTLADHQAEGFIRAEAAASGIADLRIVTVAAPTRGQADSVQIGIDGAGLPDDEPLTIFNIDTFRPGFHLPKWANDPAVAGYLEVFRGAGANWSYVRPDPARPGHALETTEKRPVSDLCCTGLYHFSQAGLFRQALARQAEIGAATIQAGEWYVAPLYNHLIAQGAAVRWELIPGDAVIFCGVPDEYDAFLAGRPRTGNNL